MHVEEGVVRGAPLQPIVVADLDTAAIAIWHWFWTSLTGRCIGLGLFTAILPTIMRMHAKPDPRLVQMYDRVANGSKYTGQLVDGNATSGADAATSTTTGNPPSGQPAAVQELDGKHESAMDPKELKKEEREHRKRAREGNPWNPLGWTRHERFWAVDFALGAWVAFFGAIADTYKQGDNIPLNVLAFGILLTFLTVATTSFVERNGWNIIAGKPPQLRLLTGVMIPNMTGALCIVLAMVHVTKLHR
jgi:hypothetical protein